MHKVLYRSLFLKWNPSNKAEAEDKLQGSNETKKPGNQNKNEEKSKQGSLGHEPVISSPEGSAHSKTTEESIFHRPSTLLKSLSRKNRTSSNPNLSSLSKSTSTTRNRTPTRGESQRIAISTETERRFLQRTTSRLSPTSHNIIFSQSSPLRKPPPIEKKLECTIEELCNGTVKQILISRDVIIDGRIEQQGEMVNIIVKAGWKKGTKITFEGKGDERPGYLAADLIFSIDEKPNPLYEREDDDLMYKVNIPLVEALTGCTISVPLIGGEKMSLSFESIHPGFVKTIRGQGMPNAKDVGKRGDLKIKFLINFPTELSDEQRSKASSILEDCCYDQ